jgi:hypothetical protein
MRFLTAAALLLLSSLAGANEFPLVTTWRFRSPVPGGT